MSVIWQNRSFKAGVLVGGAASRMGKPKSLLLWEDRTFLELVVRALEPVVDEVVLLGGGDPHPLVRAFAVWKTCPEWAVPWEACLRPFGRSPTVAGFFLLVIFP